MTKTRTEQFSIQQYDESTAFIQTETKVESLLAQAQQSSCIGLVLGSGLGPLADEIEQAVILPYETIPHFPVSTVHGHAGRLVVGILSGCVVCAMQGRFHFYEGYTMQQVTLPVRVMSRLGIKTLILTNAAGGLNPTFETGDLMLIADHINMMGTNPLIGPNQETFGLRFPAMNRTYPLALRQLAHKVASEQDLTLRQGVYIGLTGPTFETPAEVRMLQIIGGDAVGMSTVPEAIVARHADMDVLGISTITNMAIGELDTGTEPTHEEVNAAGKVIVPRLSGLLKGVLAALQS
ncbi:MAG: purine-nucleoside phosphorylase [Chloroflexota bacterium]